MGVLATLACASCQGSTHSASSAEPSAPATSASGTPATHEASKPKATPTIPADIKAACPLLTATDLKRLLGSTSHTQVVATEDHSATPKENTASHMCLYGAPGAATHPFTLDIEAHAHPVLSPTQVVGNAAKGAKAPAHSVDGVGEAATFYTLPDGNSFMIAAERSAGQVRIAIFGAPSIVPEQKFVEVEKLVLSRI